MPHYGHMLRILHCCISRTMTMTLGEMDLTSAQGQIMGYLAHCEQPPCPKDVEECFHLSHPTVSGLLARMEKKQFIELCSDPKDRRCKRIYLLPRGTAIIESIHKKILENEERIVQGFSDGEKAQFADLLARATRNMGCEPQMLFQEEETDR